MNNKSIISKKEYLNLAEIIFSAEGVEMEPEKFKVTNLQSASWCMARVSTATNKITNAEAMKDEAIRRINVWYEDYTAEHTATIETMQMFLEPWIRDEIADQKSKSVKLPNGTAGFKSTPVSVVIKDPKKIVEEAKMNDIPVQTREYVNKTDIKMHIQKTGQVLDNAFLVEKTEKFYIKIKGENTEISNSSK